MHWKTDEPDLDEFFANDRVTLGLLYSAPFLTLLGGRNRRISSLLQNRIVEFVFADFDTALDFGPIFAQYVLCIRQSTRVRNATVFAVAGVAARSTSRSVRRTD